MRRSHRQSSDLNHLSQYSCPRRSKVLFLSIGVLVPQATQMVDPGRGIDDDH